MLLIKLSSIKNEKNISTYSNHLIKKNIKYIQFNQIFIYCTHNKNEIKEYPNKHQKKRVKKLEHKRQFHGKM